MFVNFLKNDINSLRSPVVMRKATKFVEKLEMLADELQNDDSLISLIEPPPPSSVLSANTSSPLAPKRKTVNNNNNTSNNNYKQPLKASQLQTTSTVVSRKEII